MLEAWGEGAFQSERRLDVEVSWTALGSLLEALPLTSRYAPACIKLLAQYKSLMKLVAEEIGSVEGFMKRFKVGTRIGMGAGKAGSLACLTLFPGLERIANPQMDHPAALHRLTIGVPATVEHSSDASEGGAEQGKWVAETTQSFITFMDALKLNLRAKDQLHPFLTELMSGYSRFKGSGEWEGRGKILHW